MLDHAFLQTLYLTFKLAFITTFILFFIGIFLAYLLSFIDFPCKILLQSLISLPLVLPPTVLGFYLLVSFSSNSFLGKFLKEYFDLSLIFSFEGLVFASLIFSLPFMVNPLQSAFSSIDKNLLHASYSLGKGKIYTLFRVILPNCKAGIFSACAMSFAHTVGEFGVVMMIGGHKQGQTLVASIALYDELEILNYTLAHQYAFILFAFSFLILLSLYFVNQKVSFK